MHHRDMNHDAALLGEAFAAVVALERLGFGVHDLVAAELAHAGKGLVAFLALHGVFAGEVWRARSPNRRRRQQRRDSRQDRQALLMMVSRRGSASLLAV